MIKELVLSTLKEVNEDEGDCFIVTEMVKLEGKEYKLAVQIKIKKKNGTETTLVSKWVADAADKIESGIEAIYSDLLVQICKCTLEVY